MIVYFLYPETSGVRLEDMDVLFGDASTAITPATQGERGSLMSAGSPVPSLDIRRQYGQLGAESAIPGLDIDPPTASNEGATKSGPPQSQEEDTGGKSEGIGSWFSGLISRRKGPQQGPQSSSRYKRLGQGEDDYEQ